MSAFYVPTKQAMRSKKQKCDGNSWKYSVLSEYVDETTGKECGVIRRTSSISEAPEDSCSRKRCVISALKLNVFFYWAVLGPTQHSTTCLVGCQTLFCVVLCFILAIQVLLLDFSPYLSPGTL